MWKNAKTGLMLGAFAAVISLGTVGSAYAAVQAESVADQGNQYVDQQKEGIVRFHFKREKGNSELLALLKLDAVQLREQLKAGKSLAEIAAAQGVSKDAVIALLTAKHEEKLAQAVKAGKLTQKQAEKRKETFASFVKQRVEQKFDYTKRATTKPAS